MKQPWTDEKLLADLQGDREAHTQALDQFFKQYPNIWSYIRKEIRSHDSDAHGVLGDVVVAFSKSIMRSGFRPQVSLEAYCKGIAHNKCMDWHRQQKNRPETPFDLSTTSIAGLADTSPPSADPALLLRMEAQFKDAMSRLNERCRQVLFDKYYRKLQMRDIAEHTGLRSAVKARKVKFECEKKLRDIMLNYPELIDNIHYWL